MATRVEGLVILASQMCQHHVKEWEIKPGIAIYYNVTVINGCLCTEEEILLLSIYHHKLDLMPVSLAFGLFKLPIWGRCQGELHSTPS